uniref:Uncharacterized protein n=1 Tax=Octopus bimaculoides TaxID=37653 RepID=A0A0L8GH05_OCTBM
MICLSSVLHLLHMIICIMHNLQNNSLIISYQDCWPKSIVVVNYICCTEPITVHHLLLRVI